MNECLTYADFLFVIDAFEPLCTFLLLFAGYGVINLLCDLFIYIDRVWFGHVEPCPCSLLRDDNNGDAQ